MHNFQLVNCDTDSIMVTKPNGEIFTEQEKIELTKELNNEFPEQINWELEETFEKVIVVAAKNYVLKNEKIKIKGSALKAASKELALKEFIKEIIDAMLNDNIDYLSIYNKYVKEILQIKDIKRWVSRKTLTSTTFSSQRTNETKIIDAIKGTEYVEGNRIWTFFKEDDSISLMEHFDGVNYSKKALLKKLYDTSQIFQNVIDKNTFLNYTLVRNKELLEDLNGRG